MKLNKNNQVKVLAAATGFAMAALLAGPAKAATPATTTFDVKVHVNNTCDVSADTLNFGNIDSSATNTAAQSNIYVTCTPGADYTVALTSASGGTSARKMSGQTSGNTETVGYQLYQDSGHGTVWGDTVGTNTKAGSGNGSQQTVTVYGLVPSANVTSDDYKDTVTVTVAY